MHRVLQKARDNKEHYVDQLKELLRIPSISSSPEGVKECVNHLFNELMSMGFTAEVFETMGNPIIIAQIKGSTNKTLLMYGHYDVQPPDPLQLWTEPPFAANEVDGRIIARGAVDDKGNFYCILKAIQSYIEASSMPPCNIKLLLEGEEEVGSPSLPSFMEAHKEELKADAMLWFDGGIHADGRPEMCLGMKGMVYAEIEVTSNPRDYHSGKAPLVTNAAWQLVKILNSIRSEDGNVLIPGFYDDIDEPSEVDVELVKYSKLNREDLIADWKLANLDVSCESLSPEQLLLKLYFEPTCTICGMASGYTGPGSKTVLPAKAIVKIDFRLVPGQDPIKVELALRTHLATLGIEGLEVKTHAGMRASKSAPDAPVVGIVREALEEIYGKRPVVKPIVEGSGPGYVFEQLGAPYVFSRLGPTEDRSHAPNEYTTRETFTKGIETVIYILHKYAHSK